ncbi:MAG: helix-turn-helix domain-containing protein [Clostridia bacterium]|nr:helix-turn-helix domain-containing protein [Clostridia bacterium]
MKFGENLYALRKSAKMSQENLAEKVGVSRQSVSKWENGEAYPEMDNIIKICKIFHCKINDLIHDDIQDIDSLDEEIKMKVVKLEKEKQKRLKVISKIIYIISKIASVFARIGAICLIVGTVLMATFIGVTTVKGENEFSTKIGNQVVEYKKVDDKLEVTGESKVHLVKLDDESFDKVAKLLNKNSKEKIMIVTISAAIFYIVGFFLLSSALNHLAILFKNINEGDTPFTLENVHHIKQMSYLMIAITVLSAIGNGISAIIMNQDFDLGFDFITILVFYSIAYIFEYGYELQLDSKGKIYGEEDENE